MGDIEEKSIRFYRCNVIDFPGKVKEKLLEKSKDFTDA